MKWNVTLDLGCMRAEVTTKDSEVHSRKIILIKTSYIVHSLTGNQLNVLYKREQHRKLHMGDIKI